MRVYYQSFDAEFLFVDSQKQLEKVLDIGEPLPKLKEIICFKKTDDFSFEVVNKEDESSWKLRSVEVKEIPITRYHNFLAIDKENHAEFFRALRKSVSTPNPKTSP